MAQPEPVTPTQTLKQNLIKILDLPAEEIREADGKSNREQIIAAEKSFVVKFLGGEIFIGHFTYHNDTHDDAVNCDGLTENDTNEIFGSNSRSFDGSGE